MIPHNQLKDKFLYNGEGRLGCFAVWNSETDLFYWFTTEWGAVVASPMIYGPKGFSPHIEVGYTLARG